MSENWTLYHGLDGVLNEDMTTMSLRFALELHRDFAEISASCALKKHLEFYKLLWCLDY